MTPGTIAKNKEAPSPRVSQPASRLDDAIARSVESLMSLQHTDGHWVFELEADATIPAEYILLQHYLDTIEPELEEPIARYLRAGQGADGGWPLFFGGETDISATVKAYFALKAVGDSPDAPHMQRARAAILARGGARRCNVFTRIMLALWGEVPWHAVPVMPVEIMLLPRWFPFHVDKISYWSRTVLVPLLVLMALRPQARNPRGITIRELFIEPPEAVRDWISPSTSSAVGHGFVLLDRLLRKAEPMFPAEPRRRAIGKAVAFVTERLNGEDGLGGIFPAMANALMMYDSLGYPREHPYCAAAATALRKLVVEGERAYCQPCVSPVWDTALAAHALMEVGDDRLIPAIRKGLDWLRDRQVLDTVGDWASARPGLRPGGWAFQYANPHYPDLDDTAAVALALNRFDDARYRPAIERALEWVLGMQSRNGGWGSFDADNTHYYLNHIPFADHGALLDPPSADVSARCLGFLAQLGIDPKHPAVAAAIEYLRAEQEEDGSWFGRWGTNYIYGTWSVLAGLNAAGMDPGAPEIRRAVDWLVSKQRADGGWGESGESYWWPDKPRGEAPYSTASQTAWALLALLAAGEVANPAVTRGIAYLLANQDEDGNWDEPWYTAVGFPRVFYLRYHGYRVFFPLWALARYRRLSLANSPRVAFGL
jgi:squalene-hopene/tetraprenyl-beta-curcumene cyclase